MTFTLHDIWDFVRGYPWWAGPALIVGVWTTLRVAARRWRDHAEQPRFFDHAFEQNGVCVNYDERTIRLRHGDSFPVTSIRGLRWENYASRSWRTYHAFIELDDLRRPIRPVPFSKPQMPEEFVARLRTAIERAGGPRFSVRTSDYVEIMGPDYSNPITAAVAKKVVEQGRRVVLEPAK